MNSLRPIKIKRNAIAYPEGSCLFESGMTKVLCAVSVSDQLPDHAKESDKGWITAEYAMLPCSGNRRTSRSRTLSSGRTKEIQRLIGRAMRSVVDLKAIQGLNITVDCDVLQADGGTRTASINGAFIALVDALRKVERQGKITVWPVRDYVGAISVGIINGKVVLDLDYENDSRAEVDMNIVMTGRGKYIEVQGTAEQNPYSRLELNRMLEVAGKGIHQIIKMQKKVLGPLK